MVGGLLEHVGSGDFAAWVEEATAAEEAESRSGKSPEVMELEKQVRALQAKVDKVGSLLLEVGASEYLAAAMRQEEDRLRAVRGKLAEAARRQPAPDARLAVQEVAAVSATSQSWPRRTPRRLARRWHRPSSPWSCTRPRTATTSR